MSKKDKPKVEQKIADALDIEIEVNEDNQIQKKEENEIIKTNEELTTDYKSVRGNLHSIIFSKCSQI